VPEVQEPELVVQEEDPVSQQDDVLSNVLLPESE
jgi:hypothetical protein